MVAIARIAVLHPTNSIIEVVAHLRAVLLSATGIERPFDKKPDPGVFRVHKTSQLSHGAMRTAVSEESE
jgi:hypothetical protein